MRRQQAATTAATAADMCQPNAQLRACAVGSHTSAGARAHGAAHGCSEGSGDARRRRRSLAPRRVLPDGLLQQLHQLALGLLGRGHAVPQLPEHARQRRHLCLVRLHCGEVRRGGFQLASPLFSSGSRSRCCFSCRRRLLQLFVHDFHWASRGFCCRMGLSRSFVQRLCCSLSLRFCSSSCCFRNAPICMRQQ